MRSCHRPRARKTLPHSQQPPGAASDASCMTAASKALHFFPGPQLLWIVQGKVALRAEAWGGEVPRLEVRLKKAIFIIHSYKSSMPRAWR